MTPQNEFEKLASEQRERSFVRELWEMIQQSRKYWLIPIVIVLMAFGALVLLAGTGAAPFIYTLF